MRSLLLLVVASVQGYEDVFASRCALGLKVQLRFEMNQATLDSVAAALQWVSDPEEVINAYRWAGWLQAKKDIEAVFPQVVVDPTSILAYGGGTSDFVFDMGALVCDDNRTNSKVAATQDLEMALIDHNSTLRTKNVFWQHAVTNESIFWFNQFEFELRWAGAEAKRIWTKDVSQRDVVNALSAVANSTRVLAASYKGYTGEGIGLPTTDSFYATVNVAIDNQTAWPYTTDPTRFELYNLIREAILDPGSVLRKNNTYFKVWVSPSPNAEYALEPRESSFIVLQPLWALLAALAVACA